MQTWTPGLCQKQCKRRLCGDADDGDNDIGYGDEDADDDDDGADDDGTVSEHVQAC